MSDFLKTLGSVVVGVVLGFVGSIFFEPLKQWNARRLAAKRARKAIYRELGYLYFAFIWMEEDFVGDPAGFLEDLIRTFRLDAYEYYYSQQREAFYEMKDWIALRHIKEMLEDIRHELETRQQSPDEAIDNMERALVKSHQSAELDSKELKKYGKRAKEEWEKTVALRLTE